MESGESKKEDMRRLGEGVVKTTKSIKVGIYGLPRSSLPCGWHCQSTVSLTMEKAQNHLDGLEALFI